MKSVAVVPMDIHKKFSKAVAMSAEAEVLQEWRIPHGDRKEMTAFFAQFEPETDVVMEATFNWPWIADAAEEMGLSVHLAHPARAREMARGMAKSDRKDAIFLGRLRLAGEIFPEAYLAPPTVRRMRTLFRQRLLLVRMRVAIKNAVHGQLFRLGLVTSEEVSDLFSRLGREILGKLDLEEHERWLLEVKLATIDDLTQRIDLLERAIKKHLKKDSRSELLMSLPGVGELTAYALLAEIGEIERFPNGRALAAYAGLLPLDCKSAEKDFGKHTSRSCNRHLRWAMIEAVTGATRKSKRMKSLHARVRARNPKKAGKARVAVARELLELAHLLLTRGELYQEKPPARPGSRRFRKVTEVSDSAKGRGSVEGRGPRGTLRLVSGRRGKETSRPNRASGTALCARPAVRGQAGM